MKGHLSLIIVCRFACIASYAALLRRPRLLSGLLLCNLRRRCKACRVLLGAASVASLAAVYVPSAALATNCESLVGQHCYALSDWNMTNGFAAEGAQVKVDTISDSIPSGGEFFDNEIWVSFDGFKHWVESGQTGEEASGMYYFWAYVNSEGYHVGYPWNRQVRPTTNQWNTYKMVWEPNKGANSWGIWINNTGVQVGPGMEPYSKNFEAGLEETNTNITNTSESTEALTQHTNGTWSNGWEAAGAGGVHTLTIGPTCVKQINLNWAYFYGAKPCGQNGWEPDALVAVSPENNERETHFASPEEAARVSAHRYGDGAAFVEKKNGGRYVLYGHFVALRHIPPHAPRPTGTVLTVTLDPATNQPIEESLR